MAGNEWINGYLEAILDSGAGIEDHKPENRGSSESRDLVGFNATKYFVEEVVTGFDETDIHRTWMKATATRNVKLRSARLENLCWRIWNLTRKKKQLELEHAQQSAKRYYQREQGHRDTTEDMSEDISEGEKEKKKEQPEPQSKPVISLESGHAEDASKERPVDQHVRPVDQHKERRLYIVLISLHGLVRGDNMELGRDSDTGGQIKYVVEFARALAMVPEVYRVDLLTRQISSPDVDWSYGEPTEMLSVVSDDTDEQLGESSGAYIVRIPCGPRDKYLRKELLWPHIQEFVDGAMAHILNMAKVLGEQICAGDSIWPHVIHGHYADAGDIAALLSGALNVPMVLTGHSLGRNKLDQLLKQGRQSKEDINATYKIMRRIEAEELSLDAAELVITSTKQEIDEQWGLYDGFNVKLAKILRAREKRGVSCLGRYMPRMAVIPPGMDFSNVIVQDAGDVVDGDAEAAAYAANDATSVTPVSPRADPPIWAEIMRFFTNKHKPMILALARPDPKKNIINLLRAFGECRPLRELANLTLIMGNRDDIEEMSSASSSVLVSALKLIDKYDLYGLVAYPKHHRQSDVPDIYRLAAKTKGVFINPALVEPFGLTLIEAAAHGLPMVATRNGGPVDIQRTLQNGVLVNPHDVKDIADALLKLLADRNLWIECRRNGLKNIHLYSWPQHCTNYLSKVALCRMRHPQWQNEESNDGYADAESQGDSLRDVQDLSLRLSDDGERGSLCSSLLEKILRGTDRTADQVKEAYEKHKQGTKEENENKHGSGERNVQVNGQTVNRPMLRRRRRLFVIAVDSYSEGAYPGKGMSDVIQEVFKAVKLDNTGRSTGFVLATALTLRETIYMLTTEGIAVKDFDVLICSSGSQMYYPGASINAEEIFNGPDMPMTSDADYDIHIDHRWGGEGLRKVMARLSVSDAVTGQGKPERIIIEEEGRCNSHCLAYRVKSTSNAPKVDELRQCLRMRGLRCHVIYCQNASKLHVLPLHASRSQALRYMFVRWGIDVANMFVIVGETGDTDYEELLAGTHKTIILKGAVKGTSEKLLRTNGSYTREDVAPSESPNIISTEGGYNSEDILNALVKLG